MPRSDLKREDMLDRLAAHVLAYGLNGSSLRALAKGAGVSDRMLLYYFKDKSDILTATLTHISDQLVRILDASGQGVSVPADQLVQRVGTAMMTDQLWPYGRLWVELSALAALGDALCISVGQRITDRLLEWGTAQLDLPEAQRVDVALQVLARVQGALMLKAVGRDEDAKRALHPVR